MVDDLKLHELQSQSIMKIDTINLREKVLFLRYRRVCALKSHSTKMSLKTDLVQFLDLFQ